LVLSTSRIIFNRRNSLPLNAIVPLTIRPFIRTFLLWQKEDISILARQKKSALIARRPVNGILNLAQ